MKKTVLGFLAIAMTVASCQKDDNTNNKSPFDSNGIDTTKFYLNAKVDGVALYVDSISADENNDGELFRVDENYLGDRVDIYAGNNNGLIDIHINYNIYTSRGTGVYSLGRYAEGGANYSNDFGYWECGGMDADTASGILTITSIKNNVMSGTFSFTAYDDNNSPTTVNITEGKFRLPVKN